MPPRAYPPEVAWDAPLNPSTLPEIFDQAVKRFGPKRCTNFLGQVLTYDELAAMTDEIAAGLARQGIGVGSHIGLVLPNTPFFIAFFYAGLKLGATIVNFNPLYTVDELAQQAKDAEVTVMVTVDIAAVFDKVGELVNRGLIEKVIVCPFASALPPVKRLLFTTFKRKETAAVPAGGAFVRLQELRSHGRSYPKPDLDPQDIAVLQYTGGTTGTPKGVMLTHANLTINLQQVRLWFHGVADGEERMMAILPFFHVFALTGVMNFSIAYGFEMILMPRFNLIEALRLIRRTRATILPGVPTIFGAILNHRGVDPSDLASLKFCISGGAPLPVEIRKGFEKLSGCRLVEGYGLSETSPVTNINPFTGPSRDGSIGLPVPGTIEQIRSLDDPTQVMPTGEIGELCIAGPQVMKGYWKQPQETAKVFTGNFLRTGDVGYMDEDGFVFLVDRIKDIIIASGYKVYPRRIEEAVHEHPAVAEVTVIGIPDAYRGEAPKAFVKLRDDASVTERELLEFLRPRLSKIELPSAIEFRGELPKTLIGKLSKKELRPAGPAAS
nr:long-chain fatty acid--CoA ligase [Rhodoligotrophos defluvii]